MRRGLIKLRMPRMLAISFLSCRLHNDADVVSGQQRTVGSRDIPTPGEIPATSRPIELGRRRVGEVEAPTPRPPPTSPDQTIYATKKKTTTTMTPMTKTKTKNSTESTNATLPTTTASSTDSPCFFSTDEDEVTLRKTSLKHPSFSDSDSESDILPESLPRRTSKRKTSTTIRRRKPRCSNQSSASKKLPAMTTKGKVEESVAVTKRSTDPYADFRSSMAEMIVEKELLKVEELYQLLDCFLSLNSPRYHRIIIDAFEEICEALFRNWC